MGKTDLPNEAKQEKETQKAFHDSSPNKLSKNKSTIRCGKFLTQNTMQERGSKEIDFNIWFLFIRIMSSEVKLGVSKNDSLLSRFLKLGAVVEDVRTVFERLDDASIYIPDLRAMELV